MSHRRSGGLQRRNEAHSKALKLGRSAVGIVKRTEYDWESQTEYISLYGLEQGKGIVVWVCTGLRAIGHSGMCLEDSFIWVFGVCALSRDTFKQSWRCDAYNFIAFLLGRLCGEKQWTLVSCIYMWTIYCMVASCTPCHGLSCLLWLICFHYCSKHLINCRL